MEKNGHLSGYHKEERFMMLLYSLVFSFHFQIKKTGGGLWKRDVISLLIPSCCTPHYLQRDCADSNRDGYINLPRMLVASGNKRGYHREDYTQLCGVAPGSVIGRCHSGSQLAC